MANTAAILNAVAAVAKNPREAMAMLYACGAESNCESIQNLGGAPAYGPWQIYLGKGYNAGVTPAQANDPAFAAQYMYTSHNVATCTTNQNQLWDVNPQAAALAAARCIEGATPVEPYSVTQQQQGAYWMAQAATVANKSAPCSPGYVAGSGCNRGVGWCVGGLEFCPFGSSDPGVTVNGQNPISAGKDVLGRVGDFLGMIDTQDFWIRVLLVIGGVALTLMGISNLLHLEQLAPLAAAAA